MIVAYRESLGLRIYPLGRGRTSSTRAANLRQDKRIIALVSDRDLTARGIRVDFFGEPTRMPAGAANLALRTGAPLFPPPSGTTDHGVRRDPSGSGRSRQRSNG